MPATGGQGDVYKRQLDKWELGKIALKLKPEIEAKAKANMSAGGGDQKSEDAKSGLTMLSNPISAINTRKDLAESVGIGEVTMGKVMQIDEHAPAAVKEALDKKELSINQGYNLTRQLQEVPEEQREQAAIAAVEIEKAKKEIRRKDAEDVYKRQLRHMVPFQNGHDLIAADLHIGTQRLQNLRPGVRREPWPDLVLPVSYTHLMQLEKTTASEVMHDRSYDHGNQRGDLLGPDP